MRQGAVRLGPSHAYVRMVRGQITAEKYAQIMRRAVRIFGRSVTP